jgi:hypothetical protein
MNETDITILKLSEAGRAALAKLAALDALCEQQTRTITLTSERAIMAEKDLAVARELLELRTAERDACRRNLDAARDDHDADAARMKEERDAATARAEKAEAEVVKMEQANEDMAVSESYAIAEAIRSRDEVGIQYAAAQARLRLAMAVVDAARGVTDGPLSDALRALDAVPGDALATP